MDEVLPKKGQLEAVKLTPSPATDDAVVQQQVRGTLYVLDGKPLFFQVDNAQATPKDLLLPHLRLIHRFPHAFPSIQADRGALRHVIAGAAINVPGFRSKGGRLPEPREGAGRPEPEENDDEEEEGGGREDKPQSTEGLDDDGHWSRDLAKGEPVVVRGEGKEHACAVGVLAVGTREAKSMEKGHVVDETHFLGDGLWRMHVE